MVLIKKYRVNNIEDAKQYIKKDLGDEALILTIRDIKEKGFKGFLKAKKIEVTAAIEK